MPKKQEYTSLRLVLGDQLNGQHSWWSTVSHDVLYVMMEIRTETDYARHHVQKVLGFFAAMRAFAQERETEGHHLAYIKLDDEDNGQSFGHNLTELIEQHSIEHFSYQAPDEYRLDEELGAFCRQLEIETTMVDSEHFVTERLDLQEFFKGKKTYLMENFYRNMRKEHGLLMDGDKPEGGDWNYDAQNRNKMPKSHVPPAPMTFSHDLTEIQAMLVAHGVETIGEVDAERFIWPITRQESLDLLEYFAVDLLQHFGTFQDALTPDFWSLYHSRISFSMNVKLISPLEVVRRVIKEWEERKSEIDIAQVEGYVRQIIGWREYMRGVYWAHMPDFAEMNYFEHDRKLPAYFWSGNTKMACVSHAVKQSLQYAYAHHIQRLMVTGNFALLAGIDPDEIDAWYLGIYIDALEWVEITNTRGMSQYADGGIVGTKPYVSSASYLHKMGHYCGSCYYDHKKRTGDRACPFNSLYWHFLQRNREKLSNNFRMGMMYRTFDKMDATVRHETLEQAQHYLDNIETL